MIKRAEDMVKLYNEHMRGGDGTVEIIRYLEPEEFNGNAKMIAKLVFKPGCSIGEHTHEGEEEIICIAKGTCRSTMTTAQWRHFMKGIPVFVWADRHMVSEMHLIQRIWKPLP